MSSQGLVHIPLDMAFNALHDTRLFMDTLTSSANNLLLPLVCDALGVHSALLFLPDPDEDGAYVAAAACVGNPAPIQATVAPGKGLVGWILRNKQPLILNTFDARLSSLGYYDTEMEETITSFMGVPLADGGVLCVDSTSGRTFTLGDQQFLLRAAALVSAQAATTSEGMANVAIRHYFDALDKIQQLREEPLQWRTYLRKMLAILVDVTGFDYAALAMIPEEASSYVIEDETSPLMKTPDAPRALPLGSGLVGWVFNEELPVFADGIEGATAPLFGKHSQPLHFNCAICLPVTHSRTVCGVLILASQYAQSIPEGLRTFVRMATRELGTHLESLYLRHRVQSMLPRAQVYFDTAPHDPDSTPSSPDQEEL